jgi:pyruvate formate lyase activating enzyme
MIVGGVEKLTLIDFPGRLAAIIFTQGCNFRCQFCYNPLLVMPIGDVKLIYQKDHSVIPLSDLFGFLESRRGKLDGVVISGGEPTLQADLPDFIKQIRALGYAIKLDSNGTNPEMLEQVIKEGLVDYLAMDIKAPFGKYEQVVGVKVNEDNIRRSIEILKTSGVPYEFRTTLVPGLHTLEDIDAMGEMLASPAIASATEGRVSKPASGEEGISGGAAPAEASAKAGKWYLQFFKSDTPLVNREMETKDMFTTKEMEEMAEVGKKYAVICEVRG